MSQETEESLESWLHNLEWSQLLSLQKQLVSEMDRRYCELSTTKEMNVKNELDELVEELPSTQFDTVLHKTHSKRCGTDLSAGRRTIKKEELSDAISLRRNMELLSSPLKENEIILDSQASDILKEQDTNIRLSQQAVDMKQRLPKSPVKRTLFSQSSTENNKKQRCMIDFNINPITKKPWIYEDFKPNDSMSDKKGKRTSKKVARFHEKAGSPIKDKQRTILNDNGLLETVDHQNQRQQQQFTPKKQEIPDLHFEDDSFENLRVRSKSPPGYGRLNFPTTQERIDDKEESKKLLYQKTKERFLEATNNLVPITEREFYFRNSKLNDIVDDGNFAWTAEELKIFTR